MGRNPEGPVVRGKEERAVSIIDALNCVEHLRPTMRHVVVGESEFGPRSIVRRDSSRISSLETATSMSSQEASG